MNGSAQTGGALHDISYRELGDRIVAHRRRHAGRLRGGLEGTQCLHNIRTDYPPKPACREKSHANHLTPDMRHTVPGDYTTGLQPLPTFLFQP